MSPVLQSLIPVFLALFAGWLARVTGLVEYKHWPGVERVTYVLFFPALIVATLARADLSAVPVWGVGGALILSILLVAALLVAGREFLQRRLGLDGPGFTSVFQGSTRWNTFVALAVAGSLFGERGVALIAVAIVAMVPMLNILAVLVLVRYAGGAPQSAAQMLRTLAANPLILASLAGIGLNATGLPAPVMDFVVILGGAALAAGLLVAGAGLDLRGLSRPKVGHGLSIAAKMVVLPILATLLARLLGVGGSDLAVVAIASTVPTASNSYILAKLMGGDAPLMAEIIVLQTLLALVLMPAMIALLSPG